MSLAHRTSQSEFMELMVSRVNKYLKASKRPPATQDDVEAYWQAIWEYATQAVGVQSLSSTAAIGSSSFGATIRPPSQGSDRSNASSSNSVPNSSASQQRLRYILIPKFLTLNTQGPTPKPTTTSLPPLFVEISNEFQRAFDVKQRSTSWKADGTAQRTHELSSREALRLFAEQRAKVPSQQSLPTAAPTENCGFGSVDRQVEDINWMTKSLVETCGELCRDNAFRDKKWRLKCGAFGELLLQHKSIEFFPSNSSQFDSSRRSASGLGMMQDHRLSTPLPLELQQLALKAKHRLGLPPLANTVKAAKEQSVCQGDRSTALVAAPELRKHRPQTPQSDAMGIDYVEHGDALAARHPLETLGITGERPPSTCSSLGPSASARAASSASMGKESSGISSKFWKARQRRINLDQELAEVQHALETRLGVHSAMDLRRNDSVEPGEQRSATALAFHSNVIAEDNYRQPSLGKKERVMQLAIERHQHEVRARELDDARLAARQGLDEEVALHARVTTELLRKKQGDDLRERLERQQRDRDENYIRDRKGVHVPSNVMHPIDVRPFVTPSPGLVSSVAELGSKPDDWLNEKISLRKQKAEYRKVLDSQVDEVRAEKHQRKLQKQLMEKAELLENKLLLQEAEEMELSKRRENRLQYVEAWDTQREIAHLH